MKNHLPTGAHYSEASILIWTCVAMLGLCLLVLFVVAIKVCR